MYNEQLEQLIDAALADGELTEKEKQILFKKAQSFGIDLDEFEMVLDARLFKLKQNSQSASAAPKSNKYGDIKKCPGCGAMVQSFTTHCPECGQEFSNIDANNSIQKLFEMLNQVEADSKEDPKSLFGGAARTFGSLYAFGGTKDTRKKKSIVQNFPVPTTKDDMLEFLALAVPLAKRKPSLYVRLNAPGSDEVIMPKVWKDKCEQIIIKAKFSMKGDTKSIEMIEEYAKELKIKM